MSWSESSNSALDQQPTFVDVIQHRRQGCGIGQLDTGVVAAEKAKGRATASHESVEREIHGDAHQIGLERTLLTKGVECTMKPDECFLSNVFGVIAAAE